MDYQFRTALNGFNRSDVVVYLQNLTEAHKGALLNAQAEANRAMEEAARLRAENETLQARLAELQAQQPEPAQEEPAPSLRDEELEAYRRAEAAERNAAAKADGIVKAAREKAADLEIAAAEKAAVIELEAAAKMKQTREAVDSILGQLGAMTDALTETSALLNSLQK